MSEFTGNKSLTTGQSWHFDALHNGMSSAAFSRQAVRSPGSQTVPPQVHRGDRGLGRTETFPDFAVTDANFVLIPFYNVQYLKTQ